MDRVLHVVSSLERGGTEAFIMNNFRTIDRNEIQFDFFVFCYANFFSYILYTRYSSHHLALLDFYREHCRFCF